MPADYYQILGVSPTASDAQIKSAYKNLAKIHHPDKNKDNKESEEFFKNIGLAYNTLSDPWKRMSYDFKRDHLGNVSHPIAPPPLNPNRNKKWRLNTFNANAKAALIVIPFLLFVSIGGYYFYGFMNRIASQDAYVQALAYEQKNDFESAFIQYSEAIALDERAANAYFRRGLIRSRIAGNHRLALYDFNMAIAQESALPIYYFEASKVSLILNKVPEAMQYLDSCLIHFPKNDSAWIYKADISLNYLKDYAAAKKQYQKAVKLNPKSAEAYAGVGFSSFQLQQYKDCVKSLYLALHLKPRQPEWLSLLGTCQFKLHYKEEACKYWNIAASLGSAEAPIKLKRHCK